MVKVLKRAGEKSCYIEELPDEILGDIVSRLSTKEAAQACTVSQRWRNVSRLILSSCRNLDLDFTHKKYKKRNIHKKHMHTCTLVTGGTFRVMKRYWGLQLDNLRIAFHDHEGNLQSHLNLLNNPWSQDDFLHWFEFANAKQVISLDIDIESRVLIHYPLLVLEFQRESFEFLTQEYQLMIGLNSWDRLTTLSLKSVIMFDHDVDRLLSNSPNLETLLLNNIPFTKLEVKDTNPKLRRLEILHCAMFEHIHIISAPNLESLKHVPAMTDCYKSFIRNPYKKKKYYTKLDEHFIKTGISVQFENAPKLEDIYLGGPLCPNLILELHKFAPQLRKLQLYMGLYCDLYGSSTLEPFLHCVRNLNQVEPT